MTIAFATVALNIHQVGVADQLCKLSNGQFWFIETNAPNEENKKGGDTDYSKRPYLIKSYENKETYHKALQIIHDADVFVYGSCPIKYFKERVKTGKLTFLYSERWFKRGWVNVFSPRLIKQMLFYHLHCHRKPVYLLGSGGYAANDFHKMLAFRGMSYKWGYFTTVPDLDIESVMQQKRNQITRILWVARFIPLKHAERMVELAAKLKVAGAKFSITMIGTGPEEESIKQMAIHQGLSDCMTFLGALSNSEVMIIMKNHHIFCFTSNRLEGWGAVVNESMGCGCCPVISIDTGAAPYLIKEGVNGFTFDLSKEDDLFDKVYWLLQHPNDREQMSINAYRTIHDVWSPANAAVNFCKLTQSLLAGKAIQISDGPGSIA